MAESERLDSTKVSLPLIPGEAQHKATMLDPLYSK